MAVTLTFDADACGRALVQRLVQVADSLMNEFYRDAISHLSAEGKQDSELVKAKYDAATEIIEAKCIFYVQAILESFGTGSKADTNPDRSYWEEYKADPSFNEARKSNKIVGRSYGTYIDVWGHTRGSGGQQAGKNLEGLKLTDYNTGEEHVVTPISPTYSIQKAEDWIIRDTETKVERRIKMEVEKFLAEEAGKFFIEVGG